MAATTKPVTVRYRRLSDMPFRHHATSLQEAIAEAMHVAIGGIKVRDDYGLRECTALSQSVDTFVLAAPQIKDDYFFCELARFEKGANIPLCWGHPDDHGSLVLGQARPGQGREALLGVLQFMIVGNDVILIESGGIRTARLEQYLTWLLKERAKMIAQDQHLILDTEFESVGTDGAKLGSVTEIALRPIGLKETEGERAPRIPVAAIERRDAYDTAPPSVARQILGLFGNTEADIDTILHDVPPGGDLELRLSLFFKKGRQKGATNPTAASARRLLRNMEDDAIELKSKEGNIIGKLMALHSQARVRVNGSILDYRDSAQVLWRTYQDWLSSGRIHNGG